jgi:chain length determinant protein (polysaccharide antigen chain regulator)
MEDKKQETSALNQPYPYYQNDDEIDLIELWNILVKQKLAIISLTVIVTSIALAYALITPSIYQSESTLLKPTQEQLHNLQVPGVMTVNADGAFSLFKQHISSIQTRRQVFNDNESLITSVEQAATDKEELFREFSKDISISLSIEKKGAISAQSLSLSFQHASPELTSDVVKQFVKLATMKSLAEISHNFQSIINIKKDNILREITLLRNKAEVSRQDYILRLTEALAISEKTGITQPITLSNDVAPLYYRSPKSLIAEIEQLQNRKSNDPFIGGLREKQNELQKLEMLQLSTENTSVALIDQEALVPYEKIKPRRSLIVVVGFILGVMLGVFAAFIRNFTSQRKEG